MKRKAFFILFSLMMILLVIELGFRILKLNNEFVLTISQQMRGVDIKPRLSPIQYLAYIPTPNYVSDERKEHNQDGYRGEAVPLQKTENEFRILFLGGSTTYGNGTDHFQDTYPNKVLEKLQSERSDINFSIINGGLPYGTSFEILSQYLYKYKYYQADLIIINTGGNDADAYEIDNYQPDYNNWRCVPNIKVHRPHNLIQFCLKSHLFSRLFVGLTYPDLEDGGKIHHFNEETVSSWFDENKINRLNKEYNAFYNNINSLGSNIRNNEASHVVFLSFRGNTGLESEQYLEPFYLYHDTIMMDIAKKYKFSYLDYPVNQISNDHYLDECHLDILGNDIKAEFVKNNITAIIDSLVSQK